VASSSLTYTPKGNGEIEWRVKTGSNIRSIEANGNPVLWKDENGFIVFKTEGKQGEKMTWTIENNNLALSDKESNNKILIYPNPASSNISITVPWLKEHTNRVKLYTIHNRLIESFLMKEGNLEIGIVELPQGLYLVEIETINGTYTRKILKN
jgi:hypothetical protein